jgi:hypothetical protein
VNPIRVTYRGNQGSLSSAALQKVPGDLMRMLEDINGFVAFDGGLHLRGVCQAPEWHSLEEVWDGGHALHRLFPAVRADDVPFAQDCLAD